MKLFSKIKSSLIDDKSELRSTLLLIAAFICMIFIDPLAALLAMEIPLTMASASF